METQVEDLPLKRSVSEPQEAITNDSINPMTELFNDDDMRVMKGQEGDFWFGAKEIVESVGNEWQGRRVLDRIPDQFVLSLGGVTELYPPESGHSPYFIHERGVYIYVGRVDDHELAIQFQLGMAKILEEIRRTGSYVGERQTGEFGIRYGEHTIHHYLSEDEELYSDFHDVLDAAGYQRPTVPRWVGDHLRSPDEIGSSSNRVWIDHLSLQRWMWTSSLDSAHEFFSDYEPKLQARVRERLMGQPEEEEEGSTEELGVTRAQVAAIMEDKLDDAMSELPQEVEQRENTPDFYSWDKSEMIDELKFLVDRDLKNWNRIYRRYNRYYGYDPRQEYSGSIIQSMEKVEIACALDLADDMLS